jgi:hypothetical protein
MTSPNQDSFSRLMNWLSSQGADRPEAQLQAAGRDHRELGGRQDDPLSRLMNHISNWG